MLAIFHYLIFCSMLFLNHNEAARILAMFPVASISHQVVFRPLIHELVKRGHEVTIITTDPAFPNGGTPANLTEIDVHDISYTVWQEKIMSLPKGHKKDLYLHFPAYLEAIRFMFEAQIKDEKVKNLFNDKTKKFDLIIMETSVRPGLGLVLSHIYKVPLIFVSSYGAVFDNYEVVGAPVHPLLYPICYRQKLNNLSLWDKIKQLYLHFNLEMFHRASTALENELLRKYFGPDVPSIQELNNNVDMIFLNIHPVFEGIRPVPPNVLFMGGLHVNPEKELPKELQSYLDSSKNGVIYLSFGTNVDPSLLPPKAIQTLVSALSKVPYDVLWKWNKDELPGRGDNIRISKWLPQVDLLKHPKLKLFITQGGLQSTDEAISAGVPVIGIPMLGDQWFNVERIVYHNIGVGLDMETLTEGDLIEAIDTIIRNNTYFRQNLAKLHSVMRDQPQPPLERAVWWTEYVLRHGGAKHLRSPAANMSWAQYLELELVLTLLLGFLIVTTALALALRYIYKITLGNTVIDNKIKQS